MHRLRQVLWLIILFEVGAVLLFLPWLDIWESNYFIGHYPVLRPYLLHPSVRGMVSGLGLLDISLAADSVRMLMRMKPAPTRPRNA